MQTNKRMMLFFGVFILFNMAASFVHPITPTLFKDLALPDYMFGLALAAMMAVNFLFSPFWGKLNSYLSSRVSLLISCLGYALGQYFFATATTQLQFILARMLAGVFTGGVFVSALNYIVNMARDTQTRGIWLTTSATIQSVASAFGFFVGGMLGAIDVKYALIAQIITLAACGVLFLVVCVGDAKVPMSELSYKRLAREANPFRAFSDSGRFMTPILMLLMLMCALQYLSQTAFDQSFNYYLKDQFDYSPAYNGALKAVMGLVTLIANSTLCVYLIKRTDKKKSLVGLFAASGVMMLIVLGMRSIAPFMVANILFYALNAISLPLLQDVTADSAEGEDSNLVMGMFNALRSLGGIVGALAAGFLYAVRPTYPFACTALACCIGAVIAWIYQRKSRIHNK